MGGITINIFNNFKILINFLPNNKSVPQILNT